MAPLHVATLTVNMPSINPTKNGAMAPLHMATSTESLLPLGAIVYSIGCGSSALCNNSGDTG